ncbi:ATP-binding protein [Streptomyces sp. NPDC055681]
MNHALPQVDRLSRTFTQLLSSTRRGARLARLLAVTEMRTWGAPQDLTERAELVVAELAANAVLHGLVPGRCFRLTLVFDPAAGRLRVEVTDARGEVYPQPPPADAEPPSLVGELQGSGRISAGRVEQQVMMRVRHPPQFSDGADTDRLTVVLVRPTGRHQYFSSRRSTSRRNSRELRLDINVMTISRTCLASHGDPQHSKIPHPPSASSTHRRR